MIHRAADCRLVPSRLIAPVSSCPAGRASGGGRPGRSSRPTAGITEGCLPVSLPPTHDPPPTPGPAPALIVDAFAASAVGSAPARSRFRPSGDDSGMTTAEYAIGTVAACGFAGLLLKILTSPEVADMLKEVIRRAFSFVF